MRIFFVLFALLRVLLGFGPLNFRQRPDKDRERTSYYAPGPKAAAKKPQQTREYENAIRAAYDQRTLYSYRNITRCYDDRRQQYRNIIAFPQKNMDDTTSAVIPFRLTV